MPNLITHVVTDGLGKVAAVAHSESEASGYALAAGHAGNRTAVLAIASLDVAACARLAEVECPRLAEVGTGFLGAGTNPAQPYLEAMRAMRGVTAENVREIQFGYDRADGIITRFCDNATAWKGDTARAVKAHLRAMVAR